LQAQGIAVIDESALFDKLGDDIYSDDVAHFTEEGNRMLVREVANWLEQPHRRWTEKLSLVAFVEKRLCLRR
jgi:hypothetical protein